ncbi:MAG TPA: hypothetical protein VH247_08075 [Thermoleophilaceae bacterium]|nr:hypothetical protein [Thermoleophilaceae bacterium]
MLALDDLLARPAFAVDGEILTWREVIDAAVDDGEWEIVRRAALAAMTTMPQLSKAVASAADARVLAWRRERRLLSFDDTAEWFARWGVEVDEWVEHIRRQVAAARLPLPAERTVDPTAVARAEWIEAVVSGALEAAANRHAERLAAQAEPGTGAPADAIEHIAREASAPNRIAAFVEARRLPWTRVRFRRVLLADEDVAQELAFALRVDRRPLDDVAADAELTVEVVETDLEAIPEELRSRLAGARPGDVVGPAPFAGQIVVMVVETRQEPAADDPTTAARASALLRERALRAVVARHVRWLDPALASA